MEILEKLLQNFIMIIPKINTRSRNIFSQRKRMKVENIIYNKKTNSNLKSTLESFIKNSKEL